MWKQYVNAQKFANHGLKSVSEQLLIEVALSVHLNGRCIFNGYCTPNNQKELVDGVIRANMGRLDIRCCKIEKPSPFEYVVNSEKAASPQSTWQVQNQDPKTPSDILPLMAQFQDKATLYKDTGTAESAGIAIGNKLVYFADDIHLENALYKLLGMSKEDNTTLICSSKVTASHLKLMNALKPTIVISRSGFTDKALESCHSANIQCIGFCRGKHLTQYTPS